MNSFVHLHNHSYYSLLDGFASPKELATHAHKLGHKAIAITDHGTMAGVVEFYQDCKEIGIKPIIGIEAYIAEGSRTDRTHKRVKGAPKPYGHVVLLAKNQIGYKNLIRLSSLSYLDGFYYKPRVDMEILKQYRDGIICLTACLQGLPAKFFLHNQEVQASIAIQTYHKIFGDDLYIELMDHGIPNQQKVNKYLLNEASMRGIKCVATNDIHFIHPDDMEAHKTLMCIGMNKKISELEEWYGYHQNYMKTYDEMLLLFDGEFLDITNEIADKCDVTIELNQPYHISKPKEAMKIIREKCDEKVSTLPIQYQMRYIREIKDIERTNYADYIVAVADFISFAKDNGIPVGSGRGSSAGSLVCYLLGITDIDPLSYGLLFERFINVDRVEPPDIDVDICQSRRKEVIEYLKAKYGHDRVAQIATYGRLKTKASIRDACRVLDLPFDVGDTICKMIVEPWEGTVDDVFNMDTVKSYVIRHTNMEHINRLRHVASKIEDRPRHSSTHAAGVVISDRPLSEIVPVSKSTKSDDVLTQYDMHTISSLGLLKFDILGLRTLTVVNGTCKLLGIDKDKIPLDSGSVYFNLRKGRTCGIFQYEGYGYTKFIREMQPYRFQHLIALGALYRPGMLDSGMDKVYLNRMHGEKYEHKDDFLEETYGIMLYQEQVMQMAVKYGGFNLNEADILRKAIGKKDKELMDKMLVKIKDKELADLIVTFARYGWNKAHAVSYALMSYWTAYLKFNHPLQYMCTLINSEIANPYKLEKYTKEIQYCGITINSPHINLSDIHFTIGNNQIYTGLLSIQYVGEKACEYIIEERKKGDFDSEIDFRQRIPPKHINSRIYKALVDANVFTLIQKGRV